MLYGETHNSRIGVAYCDPRHYTHADLAEMFGRIVIDRMPDSEPETLAKWARLAAHYGFLALDERGQIDAMRQGDEASRLARINAEVQREGWAVIRRAMGGANAYE